MFFQLALQSRVATLIYFLPSNRTLRLMFLRLFFFFFKFPNEILIALINAGEKGGRDMCIGRKETRYSSAHSKLTILVLLSFSPKIDRKNFFFFTLSDVEIDFFPFRAVFEAKPSSAKKKTARLGKSISGT